MRKLSTITAPIIRTSRPLSYPRRPLASFAGHVTCLMLFLHDETDSQIQVSDDGDAVGAVWIPKALLVINRDRGRFLVVTMSRRLANQHRLSTPIIDFDRFTPEERADLEESISIAARARKRLSGREEPLPFPGRNAFA